MFGNVMLKFCVFLGLMDVVGSLLCVVLRRCFLVL